MHTEPRNVNGTPTTHSPGGTTRRAFLTGCARGTILAGLAVLGAGLAVRKGDPAWAERCLKQRVCQGCGLFEACALPQAEATRKMTQ
jgi:hypothetical protein